MTRLSRLLMTMAALLLLAVYVTPLWHIALGAPQYPEGLGMQIRINTVVGDTEHDLQNINGLNHYIGMRPIEPEAIPELRYMPWIVAGLIGAGLAVAAIGRRRLILAWIVAIGVFGIAGLYDFWRWSYDYGHNLDAEHAIIKIPGMSYQPPLIGTKQILNFTATSLPALGTWLIALAVALAALAWWVSRPRRGRGQAASSAPPGSDRRESRRTLEAAVVGIPLLLIAAGACSRAPATIASSAPADEQVVCPRDADRGDTIVVSICGPYHTLAAGLEAVPVGGTVIVEAGVYREPTIQVTRSVTIQGRGEAVLDGEGARTIMLVIADDVTVRGLRFRDVGTSFSEDRAAIRIAGARGCVIEDNIIDEAFFGIYLAKVERCRIARNELRATLGTEATSGNGIHLWSSREVEIADNRITGHRDGIYFEFVHDSRITGNVAERNLRYGLHFMYSDGCRYERNVFRQNTAGVAVMYTRDVAMLDNRFERNWGSAAYGLLLKEISDSRIEGNRFEGNSTAVIADGANRLVAHRNQFVSNGWAVRLMASTGEARFTANDFVGNTFDVATNSRSSTSTFSGNYWDAYDGYDLDRDGVGDIAHQPVRLFSLIVERHEPSLIMLRSVFVDLLDAAERVLPVLTPAMLADARPSMRPIQ